MILYAPYVLGAAGCVLLVNASITKAWDWSAKLWIKILTPLIGAASIFMSAIMLAGGA